MTKSVQFGRGAVGTLLCGLLLIGGASVAAAQERGTDRPPPAPTQKDRGQKGSGEKQGKQRGQKDTPPKSGGQRDKAGKQGTDRPHPKPVRDVPKRGGTDGPKPVRDTPNRGGTDRPKPVRETPGDGPVRDTPSDGPVVETPPVPGTDGVRGAGDKPVVDTPPKSFPPLHDVEKKKLQNVERSHQRRLARIDEMRVQYTRDGDKAKLADLERMIERQTKLYEGKLAVYHKDFGEEQVKRALAELPAPKAEGPADRKQGTDGPKGKRSGGERTGEKRPGDKRPGGERPGGQRPGR